MTNYLTARETAQRQEVKAFRANTERLGSMFDIKPSSDVLAWFTNTKPYKNWVKSEGGCLYYPITSRTAEGSGQFLIGALPASWKRYTPFSSQGTSDFAVAFANCREIRQCGIDDVLRLLLSQTLSMYYPTEDLWHRTVADVSSRERYLLSRDISTSPAITLYSTLNFILKDSRAAVGDLTDLKLLYIISNVHCLESLDVEKELAQLRTQLQRMGIHVLITGEAVLRNNGQSWGANDYPRVDEDTEYRGMLSRLASD